MLPKNKKTSICIMDMHNLQQLWISIIALWVNMFARLCGYQYVQLWQSIITGDPLHSRALAHSRAPLFTQPCPHCSHSRAPGEQ